LSSLNNHSAVTLAKVTAFFYRNETFLSAEKNLKLSSQI
jgi:hypothetical protein